MRTELAINVTGSTLTNKQSFVHHGLRASTAKANAKATIDTNIRSPLQASATANCTSLITTTFPSVIAGWPKLCKSQQLSCVAMRCNGRLSNCSARKGKGIMKAKNKVAGKLQHRSRQPPRNQQAPATQNGIDQACNESMYQRLPS